LVPPELLNAHQFSHPNQPVQDWLNTSEDQCLSATTREWSPSGVTEVPREDWRCNKSAFPLNFPKLDDGSCLVKALN